MTTRGRQITELELDAMLRALLVEGVEEAPRRIAEQAMTAVARTPQARPPLALRSGRPVASLWATAAAVALAIAIGVYLGGPMIGPEPSPSPSRSPSPSASVDPDALVLVSPADAGYELLLPASWQAVDSGFPDARRWIGPEGDLIVSYGTSVFDGGAVTACGPPTPEWPRCTTLEFPNSIPYSPDVDGVGALSIDDFVRDRCLGGCDVIVTETTLGGELAEQATAVDADRRVTYVSTFHNSRPVIVYLARPVFVPDRGLIHQIRDSFAFLDGVVGVEPTDFIDPTELVLFTNAEFGYEILLPRFWEPGNAIERFPTIQTFGSGVGGGTSGWPQLSISVGEADGTVPVCHDIGKPCETLTATSLEQLEGLLVSIPDDFDGAVPAERAGDITLGGEPGRFKRPGFRRDTGGGAFGLRGESAGNCLGCPGMRYFAFTIRDGRPVVITIDWWTIAFEALPPAYLGEILASFRFID